MTLLIAVCGSGSDQATNYRIIMIIMSDLESNNN